MNRAIILAAALLAAPLGAQEVHRISGGDVAVYNLAGHVDLVRGSGSDVVVRVTRGGADADRLRIEMGEISGRGTLRVVYPSDEIVYPEMGRGSSTSLRVRADGTFSDRGNGGDQVRVRGSGSGLEAWADLVVEIPAGAEFSMYLATGEAQAEGLDGHVVIDTGSGRVTATDMTGELEIDTGSGRVDVRGMDGSLSVDTGSGRVEVSEILGAEVDLDTGSGNITGVGIEAGSLRADTGSGSIELEQVRSGNVALDTGSGSVDIELLDDVDRLDVDTGSGSVTVRAPASLGATVQIETGSGGIDLDFPVEVRSVRRDLLRGTIGDGRGEIEIDTGSGSVRLLRTRNEV